MDMRQLFAKAASGHDTVRVGDRGWPVPASVAHLCTPAATVSTIHGLTLGEDHCTCGCPVEASSLCSACGRPYQTRCGNKGCDNWVQPEDRGRFGWYPPAAQCATCEGRRNQSLKASRLERIPSRLRDQAADYQRRDGRKEADSALHQWLSERPTAGFWLSGPRKSGKSTAAARAAIKAVYGDKVSTIMWLEYEDLVSAAKRCFTDDGAAQWRVIDKAHQTDLLILDDLFPSARCRPDGKILGVEGISAHALQTVSDVFRKRCATSKPTIVTSIHQPEHALGYCGAHVLNWWSGEWKELEI